MSAPLPLQGTTNPFSAAYQVRQFRAGVQDQSLDRSTEVKRNSKDSPQTIFDALYAAPSAGVTASQAVPLEEETDLFAVQTITLTGTIDGTPNWTTPTGGTFTLTAGLYTTSTLAWNVSAATEDDLLENLTSINGESNVGVTGSAGGPWVVTFANLTPPPLLHGNGALLTGPYLPYLVVVTGGQPGIEPF